MERARPVTIFAQGIRRVFALAKRLTGFLFYFENGHGGDREDSTILIDSTAEKMRTVYASPDELRARRADAGQRADIMPPLDALLPTILDRALPARSGCALSLRDILLTPSQLVRIKGGS